MSRIEFDKMDDEQLIGLVQDGIGSARSVASQMELSKRLNNRLCTSISSLNQDINKEGKAARDLTKAMYFLSGVAILVAIIQVIVKYLGN